MSKEQKKPEVPHKSEEKPASSPSGGASHGASKSVHLAKVGCHATGCKGKDTRFNFCDEHFKQFKFGLITKSGDMVSDYERKFEHYQHWLKAQKVA